jgi:hypothetical protein
MWNWSAFIILMTLPADRLVVKVCVETMRFLKEYHGSATLEGLAFDGRFDERKVASFYRAVIQHLPLSTLIKMADVYRRTHALDALLQIPNVNAAEADEQSQLQKFKELTERARLGSDAETSMLDTVLSLIRYKAFVYQQSGSWPDHMVEVDPTARKIEISPDGKWMAFESDGRRSTDLHLFDLPSRRYVGIFPPPKWHELQTKTRAGVDEIRAPGVIWYLHGFQFSPDSKYLAAWADHSLTIWHSNNREEMPVNLPLSSTHEVVRGKWAHDGLELVIANSRSDRAAEVMIVGVEGAGARSIFEIKIGDGKIHDVARSAKQNLTAVLIGNQLKIFRGKDSVAAIPCEGKMISMDSTGRTIVVDGSDLKIFNSLGAMVAIKPIPKFAEDQVKSFAISRDGLHGALGTHQGKRMLVNLQDLTFQIADDSRLSPFEHHMAFDSRRRSGVTSIGMTDEGQIYTASARDGVIMRDSIKSFGQLSSLSHSHENPSVTVVAEPVLTEAHIRATVTQPISNKADMMKALEVIHFYSPYSSELLREVLENVGVTFGIGDRTIYRSWKDFFNLDQPYAARIVIEPNSKGNFFKLLHEFRHAVRTKAQTKILKTQIGTFDDVEPFLNFSQMNDLRERLKKFVLLQEAFAYEYVIQISEAFRLREVDVEDADLVPPLLKRAYLDNGFAKMVELLPEYVDLSDEFMRQIYQGFKMVYGVDLQ